MPSRRRAFTLLELLVAMGLSSMVMLMVATTIATSVRAAGSSTLDRQAGRREDRGRALLSAQLAWIDLDPETSEPRSFSAQQGFLEFASLVSVRAPHLRSPARVRYAALPSQSGEGLRLVYMEWPNLRAGDVPPPTLATDALARRSEEIAQDRERLSPPDVVHTVIDRCQAVQFSYLFIGPDGRRMWELNWVDVRSVPRAVRVSWTTQEGAEGEWIVPVVATF